MAFPSVKVQTGLKQSRRNPWKSWHLVGWPLNKKPILGSKAEPIVTPLWYMELQDRGSKGGGINFHKGAKSKGVPVTTEGVWTTGVPFTGNSSPVPCAASVDSILAIVRKKTLIKSHMTVNLIAAGATNSPINGLTINPEVWSSLNSPPGRVFLRSFFLHTSSTMRGHCCPKANKLSYKYNVRALGVPGVAQIHTLIKWLTPPSAVTM